MHKQLYRFRLTREERDSICLAVDEADGKEVRLVEIKLDPFARTGQIKKLLQLTGQHPACIDQFTAFGSFYLVTRSASEARELLGAALACIAPPPEPGTGETTSGKQKVASASKSSYQWIWVLVGLLAAIALVIVFVANQNRQAATSHIARNEPSIPSEAWNAFISGKIYYNNKQFAQARQSFTQACDGNNLDACNYLGVMFAEGYGGKRDSGRAYYLFKKTCDQGDASGCASLGGIEEERGSYIAARTHYKKACDASVVTACEALHRFHK